MSLDVSSLFTNVPIDDIVEFLHQCLQDNPLNLPFSINILIKLIKLVTEDNPPIKKSYSINQRGHFTPTFK